MAVIDGLAVPRRAGAVVAGVTLGGLLLITAVIAVLAGGGALSAPTTAAPADGAVPAELIGQIVAAARTCPTLSAGLLAAQLDQESGFDPAARSGAGAQGIAQFMPLTWAAYGGDGDGDGVANPFDPQDAIPAAARYDCALAAIVGRLGGDTARLMLAAYNAGPGAVLAAGGVPNIVETQKYVAAIIAAAPAMNAAITVPAGSGAGGDTAQRVIAFAQSQLGKPYEWGGTGPNTWDCSGLTQAAYAAAGITLPRTTYEQADIGPRIGLDSGDWLPGDLLFSAGSDGTAANPGHVGIYLGNGEVLHAPQTGDVVRIAPLSQYGTVTGVTRPWAQ